MYGGAVSMNLEAGVPLVQVIGIAGMTARSASQPCRVLDGVPRSWMQRTLDAYSQKRPVGRPTSPLDSRQLSCGADSVVGSPKPAGEHAAVADRIADRMSLVRSATCAKVEPGANV